MQNYCRGTVHAGCSHQHAGNTVEFPEMPGGLKFTLRGVEELAELPLYRGLATKWNFDKMELLKNFYLHKAFKNETFELWGLDDFLYKFL